MKILIIEDEIKMASGLWTILTRAVSYTHLTLTTICSV